MLHSAFIAVQIHGAIVLDAVASYKKCDSLPLVYYVSGPKTPQDGANKFYCMC
jgi:hypothetical protein